MLCSVKRRAIGGRRLCDYEVRVEEYEVVLYLNLPEHIWEELIFFSELRDNPPNLHQLRDSAVTTN